MIADYGGGSGYFGSAASIIDRLIFRTSNAPVETSGKGYGVIVDSEVGCDVHVCHHSIHSERVCRAGDETVVACPVDEVVADVRFRCDGCGVATIVDGLWSGAY